jgi:hypothetical protein
MGVLGSKRWPVFAALCEEMGNNVEEKLERTLQKVDVIELQAFQAMFHRVEDVLQVHMPSEIEP